MVLSDAEETIYTSNEDDDSENTSEEPIVKKTAMVFVRGDSVILISPIQ